MSQWMTKAWMRPTPGQFDNLKIPTMARLVDVDVQNVSDQAVYPMGSLWAERPVVICFLRKYAHHVTCRSDIILDVLLHHWPTLFNVPFLLTHDSGTR
jgi:hypothetical protein